MHSERTEQSWTAAPIKMFFSSPHLSWYFFPWFFPLFFVFPLFFLFYFPPLELAKGQGEKGSAT